jgi:transcriptional regulator GlxA family with amidase domain
MVSMLFNSAHNMRDLLEQEVLDTGSWQVERVEEYIEAHLDAPFDIERIAEVTGVSTRSIYRAFKRSRGYSPMAFARQRRLQKARRMLEGLGHESDRHISGIRLRLQRRRPLQPGFLRRSAKCPSAVLGKRPR